MATKTKKRPAVAPSKNNVRVMPTVSVELDTYGNEIQGMEDAPVSFELVINNELPKNFEEAVGKDPGAPRYRKDNGTATCLGNRTHCPSHER